MAKRAKKKTEEQMSMFAIGGLEEGGLRDQGGSIDPVSGNDVPSGSTQSEVRDDIPAQLSEGEFVLPADVVRYIGLENLMELRNKAKRGLQQMEDMGQMGNSDEATMSDTASMEVDIDSMIDAFDPNDPATMEFNVGGAVGTLPNPLMGPAPPVSPPTPIYKQPTVPTFASFVRNPAQMAAQQLQPVKENREYIGPNGERISITFVNGSPSTPVPEGYKPYDAEAEAKKAPKIVAPTVSEPVQGDSRDDTEKDKEFEDQVRDFNTALDGLSERHPAVAEAAKKLRDTGTFNLSGQIYNNAIAQKAVDVALEKDRKQYGVNIKGLSTGDAYRGIEEARTEATSGLKGDELNKILNEGTYSRTSVAGDVAKILAESKASGKSIDDIVNDKSKSTGFPDFAPPQFEAQRENTPANAASDPSFNDNTTFKKGGLASPKVKTKRKPKMKRGGLASKK
tara:strand:+ start:5068 stop:6423 length:1356 start_codon:yes stop_codon:yes gene_type:complete